LRDLVSMRDAVHQTLRLLGTESVGEALSGIVGLLSGFPRTSVRNQSDSLSAFVEMRSIDGQGHRSFRVAALVWRFAQSVARTSNSQ